MFINVKVDLYHIISVFSFTNSLDVNRNHVGFENEFKRTRMPRSTFLSVLLAHSAALLTLKPYSHESLR